MSRKSTPAPGAWTPQSVRTARHDGDEHSPEAHHEPDLEAKRRFGPAVNNVKARPFGKVEYALDAILHRSMEEHEVHGDGSFFETFKDFLRLFKLFRLLRLLRLLGRFGLFLTFV